jgi:ABC-type nitrate/sulfonate/bicarbonate transport system permease component
MNAVPGGPAARVGSVVAQRLALLGLVVLGWELVARWLDNRSVPPVGPVVEAAVRTVPTEAFWAALGGTLQSWGTGMAIAAGIGIPVGLVIGSTRSPPAPLAAWWSSCALSRRSCWPRWQSSSSARRSR